MKCTANFWKFSLIAICGTVSMASSNPLLEMMDLASTKPPVKAAKAKGKTTAKAKPAQYTEKIYPLDIIEKGTSKATADTPKKATLPIQRATVDSTIKNTLEKIEKSKDIGKIMSQKTDNDSNKTATCKDCSTSKEMEQIRYGTCTDKNSYAEKVLDKHSSENTVLGKLVNQSISPNSIIKPGCMEASIQKGRGQFGYDRFKTCSGDKISGVKPQKDKGIGSPCGSEKYVSLITNSFDIVSKCMKDFIAADESDKSKHLDVLAVYGMINLESGFIHNTVSATGAAGIGQFTSTAINDVNTHELEDVKALLANHQDSSCRDLGKDFLQGNEPIRAAGSLSCDRISLNKGNPVKNMIYTYAYLKGTKEDLNNMLFNNKKYKAKFGKMSQADVQKIRRVLMIWSHNTGPSGIVDPVRSLLNSKYKQASITNADKFISQIDDALRSWPASGNNSKSRRQETSAYYPKIAALLNELETNAGGGSCLN